MNRQELIEQMRQCPQNDRQSVLDHGESVAAHLGELVRYIDEGDEEEPLQFQWKFPSWVHSYRHDILETVFNGYCYALFHDAGKPFCRITDNDGKVHFPNHAEVSKQTFLEVFKDDSCIVNLQETANLIGWDMELHTGTAQEIHELCKTVWTARDAVTLLCAALAEIHSNARMFGGEDGINSTSFKIKWKQIDRRGKQILKFYFGDPS